MTLEEQVIEKIALLMLQLEDPNDYALIGTHASELALDVRLTLNGIDRGEDFEPEYFKRLVHACKQARQQGYIAGQCKACAAKRRYDGSAPSGCRNCWRIKLSRIAKRKKEIPY